MGNNLISAGSQSLNFEYSKIKINTSFLGNSKTIQVTNGKIKYYVSDIQKLTEWSFNEVLIGNLLEDENYYLYGKCQAESEVGEFIISNKTIHFNDNTNVYFFPLALIFKFENGLRMHTRFGFEENK